MPCSVLAHTEFQWYNRFYMSVKFVPALSTTFTLLTCPGSVPIVSTILHILQFSLIAISFICLAFFNLSPSANASFISLLASLKLVIRDQLPLRERSSTSRVSDTALRA